MPAASNVRIELPAKIFHPIELSEIGDNKNERHKEMRSSKL
jgi:hypothetical protein